VEDSCPRRGFNKPHVWREIEWGEDEGYFKVVFCIFCCQRTVEVTPASLSEDRRRELGLPDVIVPGEFHG
jgi:hypothetical protein